MRASTIIALVVASAFTIAFIPYMALVQWPNAYRHAAYVQTTCSIVADYAEWAYACSATCDGQCASAARDDPPCAALVNGGNALNPADCPGAVNPRVPAANAAANSVLPSRSMPPSASAAPSPPSNGSVPLQVSATLPPLDGAQLLWRRVPVAAAAAATAAAPAASTAAANGANAANAANATCPAGAAGAPAAWCNGGYKCCGETCTDYCSRCVHRDPYGNCDQTSTYCCATACTSYTNNLECAAACPTVYRVTFVYSVALVSGGTVPWTVTTPFDTDGDGAAAYVTTWAHAKQDCWYDASSPSGTVTFDVSLSAGIIVGTVLLGLGCVLPLAFIATRAAASAIARARSHYAAVEQQRDDPAAYVRMRR